MITILGKGPLVIKRTIGGESFEASFSNYLQMNVDFIVDVVNEGKRNPSGTRMDQYTGIYYKFDLVLIDPSSDQGGTNGQKLVTVLNLLAKLFTQPYSNQYIRIIPAESDGARTEYACKLASKEIKLRDICTTKGNGQSLTLSLQTMNRDETFNVDTYTDPVTETAITDHEGNQLTDHEGESITGL